MAGLRFVVAIALAIAIACVALGVALLVDQFVAAVGDGVLGGAGMVVTIALVASALLLRPVGSRILPFFAVLPALVVALYASWLLDPAPTGVPERANLLFGIGLPLILAG